MHYFFSIFGLGYCDIELLFYSTFRVYRLLGSTNARKIRFLRVLRGLLLDDDAEGGAVMGFGGFDEDAFLSTTKVESMV